MKLAKKQLLQQKRRWRLRKKVSGTAERPRLSVTFSHKHIYAQVIDDCAGKTLVALMSMLLAVDNGSLAWLPKGNDQSLLYMNVNKPDWFLPGLAQSMLITGQQGLAWKPRGLDESIYITRNQQLD